MRITAFEFLKKTPASKLLGLPIYSSMDDLKPMFIYHALINEIEDFRQEEILQGRFPQYRTYGGTQTAYDSMVGWIYLHSSYVDVDSLKPSVAVEAINKSRKEIGSLIANT